MTINLGLVELGGEPIDVPEVNIDGYIYKFADKEAIAAELRVLTNIKRLTHYCKFRNADIRIFVNYDSQECLALAVKWLTMYREHYGSITLLFPSGQSVIIKRKTEEE